MKRGHSPEPPKSIPIMNKGKITLDWKTKLSDHICCRLMYGVHCQICEEDLKRANRPKYPDHSGSVSIVKMKFCEIEIRSLTGEASTYGSQGRIITVFPDGFLAHATRDNNEDNIREANSQGYSGPDAVWKSLVEHEYLHSLISELLYDRPSLVLETESGRKFHPSWLRYQEEAVVIGVQYLINSIGKLRQGNRDGILGETYTRIHSEVYRSKTDMTASGLLVYCECMLQRLWSQIEKDSQ